MILRSTALAVCACSAALGAMVFAGRPPQTRPDAPQFLEVPLAGIPVVKDGGIRGLSFVRLALVGEDLDALDPATVAAFALDALHDAVLGVPGGLQEGLHVIDLGVVKAALPVRLERAAAPFAIERVVLLQSEFRSSDRLRELAKE